MGKNLKGRELGKGIVQRKDGKYSGRYTGADGKRYERVCEKLRDAREYVKNGNLEKRGFVGIDPERLTVDEWFEFWMNTFKSNLSPNTLRNYRERYKRNIFPYIGKMKIRDVRAMHCQKLLNKMIGEYAISTVYQAYICLGAMLRSALLNDLIDRQPLNGVCMPRAKAKNAIRFLTVQEQLVFTEAIKGKAYENQFQLILQTGLRTGEMMGLTWDCIDFKNRMIKVEKQIEFRSDQQSWRAMPPKSPSGYRMIPMTMKAYEILSEMYHAREKRRLSPLMEDTLEYRDTRTDKVKSFKMKELVFIGKRKGEPVKHTAYCTYISKICDDFGLARISMHSLRHTFATRCIERGVSIKALQRLMGHANIATTLDIYVHVSDDFLKEAMQIFEMEEE